MEAWNYKEMLENERRVMCLEYFFAVLESNEILFKIISQTCFNVLKKKTLFGLGCAWHA